MNVDAARAVPIHAEIERRGIRLKGGAEKIGPCPVCGGSDRFGINIPKGLWHCRGCARGGDVIALVEHLDGLSFAEAVRRLTGENFRPPSIPYWPAPKSAPAASGTDLARNLWREAIPVVGTPAEAYLGGRGLPLIDERAALSLRFHPACPFGPGRRLPCLLGAFRLIIDADPDSLPVAVHRIALQAVEPRKMMLGPVGGAVVKLSPDDDVEDRLCLAEGIETTLAVMAQGFRPAWATGSAGTLEAFPVLAGIAALTIFVDPDPRGRIAAEACAARWEAEAEVDMATAPAFKNDSLDVHGAMP